ncbi:hypothetical protein AALP_AA3G179500 [Arabis alpina]|uniref:FBD domain-containing protein n=1 Tax=Arabis alpina TaxID=50452 RepID=A0A087H9Y5_ARAAL|nr:hypothetical protein AALP_AA3G179500 [Arabis alpina]
MEMFHVLPEAIPAFEKLSCISVSRFHFRWFPLVMLIKNSPNLKTLIIKGPLLYGRVDNESVGECVSEYSFLSSCPVEVLKITEYNAPSLGRSARASPRFDRVQNQGQV